MKKKKKKFSALLFNLVAFSFFLFLIYSILYIYIVVFTFRLFIRT